MHLGSIELGDIRVDVIDGGSVWLDGGGIFGIVPKTMWSQIATPDAENRVRLSFFSLLVRTPEATVVIEAGSAAHQGEKAREHLAADDSRLVETLSSLGVEPGDVDFFIPSHLHFDHVGGASNAEGTALAFPKAQHVLQKDEWVEARNPAPINKNAYIAGDIKPLEAARLMIVDGDAEITPGVEVMRTGGHSVGHQLVKIGVKPVETIYFTGDIFPTSDHMQPRWMCAFDLFPMDTFNWKVTLLNRAVEEGSMIAPGHGGAAPLCTVSRSSQGKYIAQRVTAISEPQY